MKRTALSVAIVLFLCLSAEAQRRQVGAAGDYHLRVVAGEGQREQTLELDSPLMQRKMFLRVLVPRDYFDKSASGRVYPVLYLLHGLAGHFENWTEKTDVVSETAPSDLIVVTPEGGDGWYTDSSSVPNNKYESYILDEIIPGIDHFYRTIAEGRGRMVAGLSMGGYGALKFGLKYPDRFSIVGSFSGAVDAPLRGQNSPFLRPSIISVFGAEGSKTRKDNDIFTMLREVSAEKIKSLPYIYMACGTEDPFFPVNRDFDTLLLEKKVPHEFHELPGKHEWPFWDAQIGAFLDVVKKGRPSND